MRTHELGLSPALQGLVPRVVDLSSDGRIKNEDVAVGNKVIGIHSKDWMSRFVNGLKIFTRQGIAGGDIYDRGGIEAFEVIEDLAVRRGHHGRLVGCEITFIPPNLSIVPKKVSQQEIEVDNAISFVTEVEMHSTGRGKIGSLMAVSTVYSSHRFGIQEHHSTCIVTRPLISRKEINEIGQALINVYANPERVYGDGLSTF